MKYRKNMKIGVSIIFLLLIFISSFSLLNLTKTNNVLDENIPSLSAPNDDWMEDNDSYFNASLVIPNYYPNLTITGFDEDWFQLFLNPGDQIDVYIYFNHSEGDINLELYDPLVPTISRDGSNSITDDEYIYFMADKPGDWRIRVYHAVGNTNVTYDLDIFLTTGGGGDDWAEENDDFYSAWGFGPGYYSGLNLVDFDEDWYQIYLNPGDTIDVYIYFNNSEGDLELELYDPFYTFQTGSYSNTDDENFFFTVGMFGDWRIRVYHKDGNTTVPYDLDIWITPGIPGDDWAEENDDFWSARGIAPSYYPGLKIVGFDEDWFLVYLNPGDLINVNIFFDHFEGDLQLELYDPFDSLNPRDVSYSVDKDEFISYSADVSGEWRIRVYHQFGNSDVYYDLDIWVNAIVDDAYEHNDNKWEAFNLTPYEGWWLTGVSGPGILFDEDWYEIYVEPGFEHLIINSPDFGKGVRLKVFDDNLNEIGQSYSQEHNGPTTSGPMRFNLPSSGIYYIMVYGPTRLFYDFQYLTVSLLEEQTWLSDLYGLGVQSNLDFYFIDITPGFKHLEVELLFNHTQGNIDITLHDEWGTLITNSSSFDDNEYIDTFLAVPGIYFLLIQGNNMGNQYNLWWDDVKTDLRTDDFYELNNNYSSTYDLSNDEYRSLWEINGLALQFNEDWYKISVDENHLQLIVLLKYDSAEGLMGFEIYDSNHTKITGNFTLDDNDYIDYEVPSNGTYYIRVYGDNSGNVYNLWWATEESDPIGMIPGYDTLILIISIVGVIAVVIKIKRSKFKHQ
jgi:hypothetical protein